MALTASNAAPFIIARCASATAPWPRLVSASEATAFHFVMVSSARAGAASTNVLSTAAAASMQRHALMRSPSGVGFPDAYGRPDRATTLTTARVAVRGPAAHAAGLNGSTDYLPLIRGCQDMNSSGATGGCG